MVESDNPLSAVAWRRLRREYLRKEQGRAAVGRGAAALQATAEPKPFRQAGRGILIATEGGCSG